VADHRTEVLELACATEERLRFDAAR